MKVVVVELKPQKRFVAQIGAEMIFSILISSSVHSNINQFQTTLFSILIYTSKVTKQKHIQ